jgi:small-conductance mechanosensitive channel
VRLWIRRDTVTDAAARSRAVVTAAPVDLRLAIAAGAVAIAALVVTGAAGNIHGATLHERVIAWAGTAAFLVFAVIAIRSTANETHRLLSRRAGVGHSAVIRWAITLVGYLAALLVAFGLLDVPIGHLVLGGALTGVILGIALQQSLGNIFAGIVLLLTRPFRIGDTVVVVAGALGGQLSGVVTGMGMVYVELQTPEGPLSVPNSAVLAAAVGPRPRQPVPPAYPRGPTPVQPMEGSAVSDRPVT